MEYSLKIDIFDNYIHYYLDNTYIGMLVFDKGELSDFRAIIRKNKLHITNENAYNTFKLSLYALLNHYLSERLFMDRDEVNKTKEIIVKKNDDILQNTAQQVIKQPH